MNLITRYLTNNPYYKDGKWLTGAAFRGFFLHSVGCSQPDPLVFVRKWDSPSYTNAGVNGFIGADAVYLTAPCLEQAGRVKRMPHAGSPANNNYIGFEMCEPACIRYTTGAKFTCSDYAAARAYVRATYENAVALFARLCAFHGKDPLADGVILSHAEGHRRGIATDHADPEHLWRGLGMDYTMDGFRRAVKAAMEPKEEPEMTKEEILALIDARLEGKLAGKGTQPHDYLAAEFEQAKAAAITDGARPLGYATREEVAAMVLRAMKSR